MSSAFLNDDTSQPIPRGEEFVPAHGRGVLKPFAKGVVANPGGRMNPLKRVQRLARQKCEPSIEVLSSIVDDWSKPVYARNRDGDLVEMERDPRPVIVAAQTLLTWGFGKPPDYNPDDDKPSLMVDLARLTPSQLALIRTMIESGAIRPGAVEDTDVDTPTVEAQATSE